MVDLESIFGMLCSYYYLIQCNQLELAAVYCVVVDYIENCRYVYGK